MYCGKCGKEYAEGSSFCPSCGNTLSSQQKKKLNIKINKKIIIGVVALVLVVGVVVSIVSSVSVKNNTPEKVAEKFATGIITSDFELYVECLPDFFKKSLMEQRNLPLDASDKELIRALENEMDGYENEYKNCRIIGTEIYEEFDVEEVKEELSNYYAEYYKYEEKQMTTNALMVEVFVEVEGEYEDSLGIYCIQMDDVWYVYNTY